MRFHPNLPRVIQYVRPELLRSPYPSVAQPKNYISRDSIQKIAAAFDKGMDVPNLAKVVTTEEVAGADFTLSPSRYVASAAEENLRELPVILQEIRLLEESAAAVDARLRRILLAFRLEEGPAPGSF